MNSLNTSENIQYATVGNGCFWCTEAIFQQLPGIKKLTSGYCGGNTPNPDYNAVCSGETGHAECLQIEYDPNALSFEEILEVFWNTHDPTTLNRQGNDIGTQYRSVIFYHNDEQKEIAEQYMEQLNASEKYDNPIVTTLEPISKFYAAEAYHQNYFKSNTNAPYCQFVVRPKVEKFLKSLQAN